MKNKSEIFASIVLLDGRKVDILEFKSAHIFFAGFKFANRNTDNLGMDFYIYKEIILIEGKKITDEELLNLSIDDYLSISEIVAVSMQKLEKLK